MIFTMPHPVLCLYLWDASCLGSAVPQGSKQLSLSIFWILRIRGWTQQSINLSHFGQGPFHGLNRMERRRSLNFYKREYINQTSGNKAMYRIYTCIIIFSSIIKNFQSFSSVIIKINNRKIGERKEKFLCLHSIMWESQQTKLFSIFLIITFCRETSLWLYSDSIFTFLLFPVFIIAWKKARH